MPSHYDPNQPRNAEGEWTDAAGAIKKAASDKKGKVNILKSNIIKETDKAILVKIKVGDEAGFDRVTYPIWIPKSLLDKKELDFRDDMYVANLPEWWLLKTKRDLKEEFLHNTEIKNKSNWHIYKRIAENNLNFWY